MLGLPLLVLATLLPTVGLILFSVVKSKRLADFLEALSDDRTPLSRKLGPFGAKRRDRM